VAAVRLVLAVAVVLAVQPVLAVEQPPWTWPPCMWRGQTGGPSPVVPWW
jgi:hypothetical protein